jgi:phosphatidylserine decarboxylase
LEDLLGDHELAEFYRDGCFVTLRLTAAMYHRFHAPHDCHVERVTHIRGDTWNLNPIALARVEKLFCRNERVLIRTRLEATGQLVTLVPVAAILVAGIRLHFLDLVVDPKRSLLLAIPCEIPFRKGQEMGARLCASPGCDKREWNRRVRSDHRTHQEFPPLRFPL